MDITPLPVLYGFYCRDENVECISLLPLLPSKDKNDSDRFLQWTFCRLRGGGGGGKNARSYEVLNVHVSMNVVMGLMRYLWKGP